MILSSSAKISASLTILSISAAVKRPASLSIVMASYFPVPFSTAVTVRMPLASTSNVTSTYGTPL